VDVAGYVGKEFVHEVADWCRGQVDGVTVSGGAEGCFPAGNVEVGYRVVEGEAY
jgi:hypothetical protein